jgi:hypothetical protein
VSGKGGLKADQHGFDFLQHNVISLYPDLLVLELGTNDICECLSPVQCRTIAKKIVDFCLCLCNSSTVKFVVLCQVVNRRKCGSADHEHFDENRKIVNAELLNAAKKNADKLYAYHHDRSILVNLSEELSRDNIHVTSRDGLRLYGFSVRRAITTGLTHIRCKSVK